MFGPLMIDAASTALSREEAARFAHPLVGGVILFARNYENPAQLKRLTDEIHVVKPDILIAIDQEGGRVQRCREGFTRLPPMRDLGKLWDAAPEEAIGKARQTGATLAGELLACGVDFSFAPVLDLDYGRSPVIGDRAFHRKPEAVIALAGALMDGMRKAGMASCGKHFPGHGFADSDSHIACPVDGRSLAELQEDLAPYRALPLAAVMPSHVVYPAIDSQTACFSKTWNDYLRHDIGFAGAIFSDDLSMKGASLAGNALLRVKAAHAAGCDMALLCNAPEDAAFVLAHWQTEIDPERSRRIAGLVPKKPGETRL
jgi:beta-N-acetylhexosaminidase